MTDKEQIIIDGVDVNQFNSDELACMNRYDVARLFIGLVENLQRKTQECEELQEKYEALKLENQEGYEIVDELKQECEELKERLVRTEEDLKYQCVDCMNVKSDRYRKALDEIETELSHNPTTIASYKIHDIINQIKYNI